MFYVLNLVKHAQMKIFVPVVSIITSKVQVNAMNVMSIVKLKKMTIVNVKVVMIVIICLIINA